MRVKLLVAGVLTGLLTTGGAAMAKAPPAGGARPLSPADASALAASGFSSGSVTRAVSAEEALAAASQPGATVSVEPGLSLREAVGLGYFRGVMNQLDAIDLAMPECAAWTATQRVLARQFRFEAMDCGTAASPEGSA